MERSVIKKSISLLIPSFIMMACFIAIFYYNKDLLHTFSLDVLEDLSHWAIIWTIIVFCLNNIITAIRQKLIYSQIGKNISFYNVLNVTIFSQLSGFLLPSFIGSLISQTIQLKRHNLGASTIGYLFFYERLIAAFSGCMLAIVGAYILCYKHLNGILDDNPILYEAPFLIVFILGIYFTYGHACNDKKAFKLFINANNFKNLSQSFLLSTLANLLTASAYVSLLFPYASKIKLLSGGFIVVFCSSLPISLSGWGVREAVSVGVFKSLGIQANIALGASIIVGIASIIVLLAMGLVAFLKKSKSGKDVLVIASSLSEKNSSIFYNKFERMFIWWAGIITSVFIFFNFKVQFQEYSLNLNLADILSVFALVLMIFEHKNLKKYCSFYALNPIPFFILFFVAACFAFIHGALVFGVTRWAASKLTGLLILYGYASLGILFAHFFRKNGVEQLVNLMGFSLACILIFRILEYFLFVYGIAHIDTMHPFEGFANNRNAFCMQILFCLCGLLPFLQERKKVFLNKMFISSMLITGVIMTYSRSGQLTCLGFFIIIYALKVINLRDFMKLALLVLLMITVIIAFISVPNMVASYMAASDMTDMSGWNLIISKDFYSYASSDSERIYTLIEGFKLWVSNPLFGTGLGAFVFEQNATFDRFLVIHNSFLWLLAEFGIVGSAPIIAYIFLLVSKIRVDVFDFWKRNKTLAPGLVSLLGLLFVSVVLSLAHDLLYQRTLWLLFGCFITLPTQSRTRVVGKRGLYDNTSL